MTQINEPNTDGLLYEQVARHVADLVTSGTLLPGERVPSVRQLKKQLSVSVSTVMQAYRLLEDRKLIRAVPQSGYFVREPMVSNKEPTASHNAPFPNEVECINFTAALMDDANHEDMVQLGAALPDARLLPMEKMNRLFSQVVRVYGSATHEYAIPQGRIELRRQMAKRLMDAGCSIGPDDIVVTNGASEAINLSLRATTQPGDVVAIESPTFFFFIDILRTMNLKAHEIATRSNTGMDMIALEKALQEKQIKAIILASSYANPLGTLMPMENRKKLVELAKTYNVTVIEDEVYGELSFNGTRLPSLRSFDDGNHVITLGSFSKTISPGLRVGWCVPGKFKNRVLDLKATTNHASATLPQLLVATYLEQHGYDRHLRKLRKHYKEQVDQVRKAIAKHFPSSTRVSRPQGSYVIWVEMPVRVDTAKLYKQAIEKNVSIAPGRMFSSLDRYANCMRINCGLIWDEKIENAIATLGQLVKAQLEK